MPQKTQTPGSSSSDSLNPSERLYQQETNPNFQQWEKEMGGGDDDFAKWEKEMGDQGGTNPANSVREREINTPSAPEIPYEQGPPPKRGVRLTRQQKISAGIGGGLITLILGFATFSPFGMLIHLKEIASDWSDKFNTAGNHTRMKKLYAKRYFGADQCNGPIKIKCRLTPKIQGKELEALRRRGLNPEVNAQGRVTSMTDPSDPSRRITAANFETEYANNVAFTSALDRATTSPRSVTWRGPQALKKMINFLRINRKAPAGDSNDPKKITTDIRETQYTSANDPPRYSADTGTDPSADPNQDSEIKKSLTDLFDSAEEQAEEIKKNVVENGPPPSSVVDGGLDPSTALERVSKGTVGGAIKGPLGFIDSFCQLRRAAITASTAIKIYQHLALIKFAAIFMVMADKMKAGDGSGEQMAVLGNAITRPSVQESSKGLTISESALVTLMTEGTVKDYDTASRFTNGDTYTHVIDLAVSAAGGAVAASVCKKIEAWYGQVIVITTGVGACAVTFGASCVAGAIKGTIFGLALSLIIGQFTPKIVHLLAGTIAPDLLTDPEGGYGIGNAIASGMGALGLSSVGRANGLKPATKKDYELIAAKVDNTQRYLASVEAAKHPGLFDPENPHGVSRQLATHFTPQLLALESGNASMVANSFASLVGSAPQRIGGGFASLMSPAYAATEKDKYRSDFCKDPQIKELDIKTDAFCNMIFIPGDEIMDEDPAFDPDKVMDYVVGHDHVDGDTGAVKSDKFKEYIEKCVDSDGPYIPNEEVTKVCFDTRDETDYKYFRAYIMDRNILDSMDQIEKGTFGHGEATAGSSTPPPAGDVSTEGWTWPAAMPIHNGPCFGGPRAHAGMDINTTSDNNPALAMHAGKVSDIGSGPASGNYIIIEAAPNLYYGYQHLKDKPNLAVGATVTVGQPIGIIGRTGNMDLAPTTKGHLHVTLSTKSKLGGYGSLGDMLDPMTVLKTPAPGGYKCTNT